MSNRETDTVKIDTVIGGSVTEDRAIRLTRRARRVDTGRYREFYSQAALTFQNVPL